MNKTDYCISGNSFDFYLLIYGESQLCKMMLILKLGTGYLRIGLISRIVTITELNNIKIR